MRLPKPVLAVALGCCLLLGCAAGQIHPGAANTFDSSTYDVLIVTQSVINTTKADLAANSFPASIAPKVKTAVNALSTAYDTALNVYVTYHNAAIAGTATPAQATAVTTAVQNVNMATTALNAAKVGQ
jgi:hypothetical protein